MSYVVQVLYLHLLGHALLCTNDQRTRFMFRFIRSLFAPSTPVVTPVTDTVYLFAADAIADGDAIRGRMAMDFIASTQPKY